MTRTRWTGALLAAAAAMGAAPGAHAGEPAPKNGAEATMKLCEETWPATAPGKASTKDTWTCVDYYLTLAYGKKPDAEMLTLDPGYGMPQEVKLPNSKLDNMIGHVAAACDRKAAPVESECNRGAELFEGIKRRRLGLLDDTVMESIEPVLAAVLKGEKLTRAQLRADEEQKWSPLTLWKLRNAAYARHGFKFKTPDLNTFFYGPRDDSKLLPIAKGDKAKVELTPDDVANVQLIKTLETHKK